MVKPPDVRGIGVDVGQAHELIHDLLLRTEVVHEAAEVRDDEIEIWVRRRVFAFGERLVFELTAGLALDPGRRDRLCAQGGAHGGQRHAAQASPPLNGWLPLWPTLRSVELTFVNAEPPAVVLWGIPCISTIGTTGGRRLTPRARELIARSVERRPEVEMQSLSAAEWFELEELLEDSVAAPREWAFKKNAADENALRVHRRAFSEPWLYLFGFKYDSDRRFAVHTVLLTPARWTVVLLED